MQSMNIYLVTGKDHCGFSVRAKTAADAEKKARKYRGFSVADRPILCVKLFYGAK